MAGPFPFGSLSPASGLGEAPMADTPIDAEAAKRFMALLGETWPAKLAQAAARGVAAPGNAYKSTPDNPVTTEQMVEPAADLAGVMVGFPGGSGGLGSGARSLMAHAPEGPLSFSERMAKAKDLAMENYNRGRSSGTYGIAARKAPDAPKGSFERLAAEQRAKWNADKQVALDDYRKITGSSPTSRILLAPGETIEDFRF